MDADREFLAQLPSWGFAFALLIARTGSACMLLPGIGEVELPAMLRAGFTVALAALLLPVLLPLIPPMPASAWGAFAMIGAEVITGLWLGWLARLLLLALPVAGQIVASMTGLANVLQPDPALGPQTSVLARALGMAAPVAVLATGLHALPLQALAGSYRLIAPGTLLPAADTAEQVTMAVATGFALALRLAAPFVLVGIVFHAAMGLLARLVPNMQVYFALMPGQILGGLALLALLAATLLTAWQSALGGGFAALPGL